MRDLLYLMRGKDIEKPPVIVLINSTKETNEVLKRELDLIEEHLLESKFILQITELEEEVFAPKGLKLTESEDIIPISLCVQAAKKYCSDFGKVEESKTERITDKAIEEWIHSGKTLFDAVNSCSPVDITKMGFARSIVDIIQEWQREGSVDNDAKEEFVNNFKSLFDRLNDMKQEAVESLNLTSVKQRVERHVDGFIRDHQITAKRSDVRRLLKTIENTLDNSEESNRIKLYIQRIYNEFSLDKNLNKPVDNYEELTQSLERIAHEGRIQTQVKPLLPKNEDFKDESVLDTSSELSDRFLEMDQEEDVLEQTSQEILPLNKKSEKLAKTPIK